MATMTLPSDVQQKAATGRCRFCGTGLQSHTSFLAFAIVGDVVAIDLPVLKYRERGICLTQVAPIFNVRGWWSITPTCCSRWPKSGCPAGAAPYAEVPDPRTAEGRREEFTSFCCARSGWHSYGFLPAG